MPLRAARAAGDVDPGWAVAPVSTTTNLADGQRILINLRSTRSDVSINAVEIHECQLNASYTTAADLLPDTGKCPNRAVSTSADYFVIRGASDGLTSLAKTAGGANVPFVVGQGVVSWTSATKHTLTCDPSHACALVLKLSIGSSAGPSVVFQTVKLSFADANPLAGCGGFASDVLTTGGSDEISDAWVNWTRSLCASTHEGAPTRVSFLGEGPSVASFSSGALDLVYTSAGYDSSVGFVPAGGRRPAIAVPIALNAAVVAAGGGQHQIVNGAPIGDKARYPDGSLSLTAAEVGALLGGGVTWISRFDLSYAHDILTRNPALHGVVYAPDAGVSAPSVSLASTWYLTNYLSTVAPNDFVKPGPIPAPKRGATASLALAQPPFDQLALYTGRPTLAKATVPEQISATDGPLWAVTDLASARALDLTPVALQSGGGFVAPTTDSMNAAVAAMTPDAEGMLVPTPSLATTAVAPGAVQPYPLTYVVYAMVPAQPLVDPSTCKLRTGSQAELNSWLRFVLGAGQSLLPAGMQPLPPALLSSAKSSIAEVGAAKLTGACAGRQPNGGGSGGGTKTPHRGNHDGTATPPGDGTTIPSFSGGSLGGIGGIGGAGSLLGGGPSAGSTGSTPRAIRAAEAAVHIPAFAGRNSVGALGGILALLAIALLTSGAAWLTASQLRRRRASTSGGLDGSMWARVAALAVMWVGVVVAGVALVMFALGPALQERDQRSLVASYRTTVSNAANELQGLPGATAIAAAPDPGSPVGIVEIGALRTQDVVVEGVGSAQTSRAPGHVPGTAGLGQPGNSVVVAHRQAFGGDFEHLGGLHTGDKIVVTTTQGQSVYVVREVHSVKADDALYAPSSDDRLTLVTNASALPWENSRAVEVVAKLSGKPFAPTPQQARSTHATGTHGDSGSVPAVVLALLVLAAAIAGSVALYGKLRVRAAYILSVAPLVAVTVVAGETIARLLPAWS